VDSRYKNLGIIVAIIIAVAAVYLFVPLEPVPGPGPAPILEDDFESGLDVLKDIFNSKGVELFSPGFVADLTSLNTAQLSSLNSNLLDFKSNLNSYDSESKAALDEMADISIQFVDFIERTQEFDVKLDAVSALSINDYCDYTVLFESRDLIGRERIDLLENIDSSISSFNLKYPVQSQISGLDKIIVINLGVELAENQFEMEKSTVELKDSCGGI